MKESLKIFLASTVLVVLAGLVISIQYKRIKTVSFERDKYARNTESLLSDVRRYQVRDSLHAANVEALELNLKEFERFRAEDAALIKQLKAKNRDLTAALSTQSQTIIEMSSMAKDTIVIRDTVKLPALALHCGDEWYDFDGVLVGREFSGNVIMRDSLLIAETVQYKRFLGFLWKTKEIKNRTMDVVSKNPHTVIQDCELITIEK